MDTYLGFALVAVLLGFGSRQWRAAIREKVEDIREDRRLRRKYDF